MDDHDCALKLQAELDAAFALRVSLEEQKSAELARKLQEENDKQKAQELHDAEVAKKLDESLKSRVKLEEDEELGRLAALRLHEEEVAVVQEEQVRYVEDRAKANALYYSEMPSYKEMAIPCDARKLPHITLESVRTQEKCVQGSTGRRLSVDQFCKELIDPNSVLRSAKENVRLAEWWESTKAGESNKALVPTLDMHGLTVAHANHRLYPFLKLTRQYGHKRVVVCCGIGSHSKKGKSRLRIMITKVLDKLLEEKDRNARLIQRYEVVDGSVHITFP